jgi:hypothetical protein
MLFFHHHSHNLSSSSLFVKERKKFFLEQQRTKFREHEASVAMTEMNESDIKLMMMRFSFVIIFHYMGQLL